MSRSNYDKPFYVDVGTSVVAIRCASNHDVVLEYDHARMPYAIELAEKNCDRMNKEVETRNSGDVAKLRWALVYAEKVLDTAARNTRGETGMVVDSDYAEAARKCRAALAAPARNCDRFATVDEARKAHEEYRGDYIMRASNIFDFPMEFEAWLFAPRRRRKEA